MYTSSISRGFAVELFTVLLIFSQNLARFSSVLSLMSYPLVTVLHLESFENNLFELDFLISKRTCFYTVKPYQNTGKIDQNHTKIICWKNDGFLWFLVKRQSLSQKPYDGLS